MPIRPTSLGEIAELLGRDVDGDADFVVRGVASLDDAGPGDLVFARSVKLAGALAESAAGAVIGPPDLDTGGRPAIRSPRPDLDFARAVARIAPAPRPAAGVHPSAVVAEDAEVDASASVGAHAVIGAGCSVGPRTVIHPHVVLYDGVRVGAECVLHAGCVLMYGVEIGDRVSIDPCATLGADGFGYALDEQGRPLKFPQIGRVVVDDDAEIGAGATIDRATLGATRIGRNAKVDNLCVVSHNCQVGDDVLMVALTGLGGSTVLGRGVVMMGQSATAGHLRVGAGAFVGGRAGIIEDVEAGSRVWGFPAVPERQWHRAVAALQRLPQALRRLRAVERQLGMRPSRDS